MELTRALAARCERLANRLIAESTPARTRAGALEGRSMSIELAGLDVTLRAAIANGTVELGIGADEPADVKLSATPLELLRLARAESTDELKSARTRLDGDVHVAEGFAELARLARPDLEDELARWIGDIAAHETAELGRRLGAYAGRARRALELDTAEYLQEEQRLVPGPHEVAAFSDDVDRLRDDVDRAEARLERIAKALKGRQ